MTKLNELKSRWMADPEFRAVYEEANRVYAQLEAQILAQRGVRAPAAPANDSQIAPSLERKE